jgi:hypothetical protein
VGFPGDQALALNIGGPGKGVAADVAGLLGPITISLADGKIDKLLDRVYELALSGDPAAIRIILDRVLPSLRSESLPVRVDVDVNASLTAQARAIVRAAVEGRIAPDTASELIKAIASVGAVSELDELRRRVDQLQFGDLA